MAKVSYLTSESVTEGHPDKICDQISDAILDALIKQDKNSRCATEVLTTTGLVIVAGEITTRGYVEIQDIVRKTLKEIGYTNPEFGIDCNDAGVMVSVHGQSPDIAQGVDREGAGDQGMMYGYACRETPQLMPLPIMLAHGLTRRLAEVRKGGIIKDLGPDGKSQVSVEYHDGAPQRLTAVVIAQQHLDTQGEAQLKEEITEKVILPLCHPWMDEKTKIYVNATGKFVIGGPEGDTGVTGRKIICDTYGGIGRHGGGAFSGKDPTKVDRSGAYAARYVAKNVVAADLADRCEVQLSYAIGVAQPTSIDVNTFGTNKIPEERIVNLVREYFPLTPRWIISHLDLRRPIYQQTAAYGHFGREEPEFTWEKTDLADVLRKAAGI